MARTGAALSVELEMQRTATLRATARRDAIVIAIRGVECFRRRQGQNCKLATAGVAEVDISENRLIGLSEYGSGAQDQTARTIEAYTQYACLLSLQMRV